MNEKRTETIEYRKSNRWYIVGIVFFILFIIIEFLNKRSGITFMPIAIGIALCLGIPRYITQRIFLKDSSINLVRDLVNTKDINIPYSKINSVKIDWVWSNAGSILISTSDEDYYYKSMNNIEDLRQKLNDKIEGSLVNSKSSIIDNPKRDEPIVSDSDTNELAKLALLKNSGDLSEDEYNKMKQKIINR